MRVSFEDNQSIAKKVGIRVRLANALGGALSDAGNARPAKALRFIAQARTEDGWR